MTYSITLPIPSPILSPNARCHWATKSRATHKARTDAHNAAIIALGTPRPMLSHSITAQVTVYTPDKRRRDKDNYLARCKAYFDGFTDAHLWTDDSRVTHLPLEFVKDAAHPRVVITVTGYQDSTLAGS